MLNKSFVTQLQFSQIVMATFLGSNNANIRSEAGVAVALIWSLDPLKLHTKLKKKEMSAEASILADSWNNVRPDWSYT